MSQSTLPTSVPFPIARKLRLVRSRKLWVHVVNAVLLAVAVLVAAMGVAMLIDYLTTLYDSRWRYVLTNTALTAAALTSVGWLIVVWQRSLPWDRLAGDVDREIPQLEQRWTTMTRLEPADAANPEVVHPAMLRRVAEEAMRWEPHVDPQDMVSLTPLVRTMLCLTVLTLVLAVAVILDARQTIVLLRRFWSPGTSISATELVDVPGSTVVGRGEPLLLKAAVAGRSVERATLFLQAGDDAERAVKLVAHGSDLPEFAHNVRSVEKPFAYRFRAGDGQTPWYTVDVADRPEIDKLELTVTPPAYTKRPAKTFDKLPRRVSVLQNSELEFRLRPKAAVQQVELRNGDISLAVMASDDDGWYRWRTTLKDSFSLAPLLSEPHGLTNRQVPRCEFTVYVDKPPAVRVLTPDDQMAVRPDDAVDISFAAQDDVGIGSAELVVYGTDELGGETKPLATIPIPLGDERGERSVQGKVQLDLSKFKVSDGSELSYEIRVREDRGPAASDIGQVASTRKPAGKETMIPPGREPEKKPVLSPSTLANREPENSKPSVSPPIASNSGPAKETAQSPANTTSPRRVPASGDLVAAHKPSDSESKPANGDNDKSQSPPPGRMASSDRRTLASTEARNESPQPSGNGQPSASTNQTASANGEKTPAADGSPSSTPSPGDSMPRRSLDVAQSSSSQRMRLKVDQWAGSFSGQQRSKIEMAIAPKLAALDQELAKAQRTAQGVLEAVAADGQWRAAHDRDVTSAEQATVRGQNLIRELQQRSKDTPYAFVGLQVADIGLAHVDPARTGFWTAHQSDGDERMTVVRDAWQHLGRARELLAELRGQFERTRQEFQLAESVERIKKMYQLYVENSMALLPTKPDDPSRYGRKPVEFDLDDEYLARLQEVMKMREELRAELARILADDPRLLRRMMDSIRNRSENLREELAELVASQKNLDREVRAWTATEEADRPRIAELLLLRQLRKSAGIAAATGELQDRYQAWLPLERESKDASLASATKTIQQLTTAASALNSHVGQYLDETLRPQVAAPAVEGEMAAPAPAQSLDSLLAEAQGVYDLGSQAELALRQLSARGDDAEIALFATNRLLDTRKVISATSAWVRQIRAHQSNTYARAAEVDQYRLAMTTDELAGKLGSIEQTLAGLLERRDGSLPEPIAVKAREFMATLDNDASPNQLAAVYALRNDDFPRTVERQAAAEKALVKAEQLYDEMIKLAIQEMDKLPVQDPIANLLDDPTLDELLAQLEQELPLEELLGVPPRQSNLQIVSDWLRPGGNISMGGRGGQWMMQQFRNDDLRARQRLDRAYRRAVARALKESTSSRKIAIPKQTKLSDWNRLVSRLNDDVGQGRDKAPPEQYRRAIEQYFAQISKAVAEQDRAPAEGD
jgi:hypothetical protein